MAKLHYVLISSSLLLPVSTYSLGLGKMNVLSGLNQPLKAEIEVLDIKGTPIENIHVEAASQEYFARLSMERPAQLSKLIFKVTLNSQNHPVIRVTSSEAMTDPYMQLLLDVSWPNGKYYRAYNVLLDPVTPAVAQKSETVAIAQQAVPATNEQKSASVEQTPAPVPATASYTNFGKVSPATSLWKIAETVSETHQVSINQAMLGIAGANPSAFIHGNINGLKSGQTIRIPNQAMLQSIDDDQATREVQQQNQAWKSTSQIEHALQPPYYQVSAATVVPAPAPAPQVAPKSAEVPLVAPKTAVAEPATIPLPLVAAKKTVEAPAAAEPLPPVMAFNPAQPKDIEQSSLISSNTQETSPNSQRILQTQLAISAAAVGTANQATQALQAELSELKQQNAEMQARISAQNQTILKLNTQIAVKQTQDPKSTAAVRVAENGTTHSLADGISGQAQELGNPESDGWANKLLLAILMIFTGGAISSIYWKRRLHSKPVITPPLSHRTEPLMPDHMPIIRSSRNKPSDALNTMSDDELASKLDLATAYLNMDDKENAKILLQEVLQEGSDLQKEEAKKLLDTLQ